MQGPAVTHLSVRVPWQDTRWDGRVCTDPANNQSCVVLKAIAENRNDAKESGLRGQWMTDLALDDKPPCFKERATFLSDREVTLQVRLDYAEWSDPHKHIQRTPVRVPAYGATLVPFRWLLRENAYDIANEFELDVSEDREPTEPAFLAKTDWVQNHDNQQVLLDAFSERCVENESLVFFYAKRTPLADDDRRVIVAVGLLSHKGKVEQYDYDRRAPKGHLRAMMWERPIQHSIRPDKDNPGHFVGGIVLPYHAILERAASDVSLDTAAFLACAPDEARAQFSYASEHVSHGAAITSLTACKAALERASKHLTGPFPQQIAWIDEQINRLWKLSGPCPGLGSALSALEDGFNGTLFALALSATLEETDDPWAITDKIIRKELAPPSGAPKLSTMLRKRWEHLHKKEPKRAALLRLLSRFELTRDQAVRCFEQKDETEAILKNPYLLFERDRTSVDPIGLWMIDRGLFSDHEVFKRHRLPAECTIDPDEPDDPRRLRAVGVMILETAAKNSGHTLLSANDIHEIAKELPATRPVPLDGTAIEICEDEFSDEIVVTSIPTLGGMAAQLKRYSDYGSVIRRALGDRLAGRIAPTKIDWRAKLDKAFGAIAKVDQEEEKARKEKAFALDVMANNRLSVLIGAAGTGKTTVLRHLLEQRKIVGSGVALLAPTGKARVRLGQQTGLPDQTQTLAQFLRQYQRYNGDTGRYFASKTAPQADGVTTCIVDEASMLTEDQLAALVDALPVSARLIFVGDPRQLPPIGAGRPFVDLISHLEREHGRQGVAELTVRRRHASAKAAASGLRDLACSDVQLADLFSGRDLPPGEDEILERVLTGKFDERLRAVSWKSPTDLRNVLDQVLIEELDLPKDKAENALSVSLGGNEQNGYVYFNPGRQINKCEEWQILTPHRNQSSGSLDLNRHIKSRFRSGILSFARRSNEGPPYYIKYRTIVPRGPEQITYGDKVICIRNHDHQGYDFEKEERQKGYIANGEIGVVVGDAFKANKRPRRTNVQFASQPDLTYGFSAGYFSEEATPILELAYAVTVHKAQGSEFGKVFLVLPERSRLLSREMLYTALTRQMDRVVILHQGGLTHLRAYRSPFFSEVARRVTNLFAPPSMIEAAPPSGLTAGPVGRTFLEEKLIHRSARGDLVSSKSELVIADLLLEAETKYGIRYFFERAAIGADGETRWPDFSIEDRNGQTWYWEHCGMLGQQDYDDRWKKKLAFYDRNGVKPWREASPGGRLIVTEDGPEKGLDSAAIRKMIEALWSR
ncbi:UvrD-like helicase C-terminal domain-containing protein [Bradyrhizobium sp. Ghvi]|uniref:AAA family ATPase n=1 Tax=Bradyrhizobium sp. Ghvi TaxID=1855319 RepID=UPI0008E86271|nr:AAA family ATPase [Bradyrhizobium sp. Ghvi]SFP37404.1 UvrD-like helicase C-terminal domain-containing protein [Bradyrhizobium sp. Ghvi]